MTIPAEFTAMVRAYADDLHRYARWLCRDPHKAEDLVQETFLRSWRGFEGLRQTGSAKAWLITTLRREYFRACKSGSAGNQEQFEELAEAELESNIPRLENSLDAERCLNRLPDHYREVLFLQLHFGYSTTEIAELLKITEPAVANRLLRARSALAANSMKKENRVIPFKRSAS